eukprot:TRINITY_DN4278_c0_g1_i1.p1 TRINITY_DN4278_c0_g1~~TRINITY_DN4278_c0_g1_i1.p1  ORF type:complete len:658 (-),score=261.21 TRINITY_DN4278_c0_g1_i1:112-2004(-)
MPVNLTGGALLSLCEGGSVDKPLLQILGHKKIMGSSSDRYRLLISDGEYSNSFAMLATQMNSKITGGLLENYTVIRANKCACNNLQGKKVIILLDIDVITPGAQVGEKIGSPRAINPDGTINEKPGGSSSTTSVNQKRHGDEAGLGGPPPPKKAPLAQQNPPRSSILDPRPVLGSSSSISAMPIQSLTPYQNKWTIQGRVTNKSDIRRWSNSRGEGHLFNFDVLDASGSIKVTAFTEQCDRFHDLIEIGKVYFISGGTLKAANKQYNNTNNDYEITLKDTSEISLAKDADKDVPCLSFDFVKIADLSACAKDSLVDIIGVVKVTQEAATITSQRTQKEIRKRDLVFLDTSLSEVNVTIWGSHADNFEGSGFPVVAIKGAKVSDYNGVSLSALTSSTIQINPDIPQAHKLKGWFESEGSNISTTSLTTTLGGGARSMGGDSGANAKTLGEVKQEMLGSSTEKPDYYSTQGYVSMLQKEKALYMACTQVSDGRACNKKVQDNNGSYRCEKCNVDNDDFQWRLILNILLVDSTDSQWVNCFQETGETILGLSAQELGTYYQHDQDKFNKVFKEATFKAYNFRVRTKADNYNGESKARHTIMSLSPVNHEENNKKLMQELSDAGIDVSALEESY